MFELEFEFAYLFLSIPFLIIWLLVYALSKTTRREQLLMSLLATPLGPLSEIIYFQDYWLPASAMPISFGSLTIMGEDLIFAFAIGGLAAVLYEAVFRKGLRKSRPVKPIIKWPFIFASVVGVAAILFSFGVNSIFATSLAAIVGAFFIIVDRRDLFEDAFFSGILVSAVMFFLYVIEFNFISNSKELIANGWLLNGSTFDVRLFGVPLTELIWGFSWGAFAGPLYEFWRSYRIS